VKIAQVARLLVATTILRAIRILEVKRRLGTVRIERGKAATVIVLGITKLLRTKRVEAARIFVVARVLVLVGDIIEVAVVRAV
jgi:hypothetical protein